MVWIGGGNNALGLPHDLDVLPHFDQYIQAFANFGPLVLSFLNTATDAVLTAAQMAELASFVALQSQFATTARDNTGDELPIAESEKKYATDEVAYAQQQLDQVAREIQAALAEMRQKSFSFGDLLGTVAEVGAAVVSVVAAVPTGGASLVALVPSMIALADTVTDSAEPIAKAVFAGDRPDVKAVTDAYKKVDKELSAVIKGTKSIVNFVTVVQRIGAGATPDNAKHVALVKRGAELTHELLLAGHRSTLAEQRLQAVQARLARANEVVIAAEKLQATLSGDAASVKAAGMLAIQVAQSKMDVLLSLAFRAQRSVEIYTLQDEEQNLALDAGLTSPDIGRQYYEEEIGGSELVSALVTSWGQLLDPLIIQGDYTSFFANFHDQDTHRISFRDGPELDALKPTHRFTFRVEATDIDSGHFDAKVKSVRLAFVGATHPDGEISCTVRHAGRYEQRRSDGTIAVQMLEPRLSTRPAKTTPLQADEGLGFDPPLTAPRSLAFWGRGIGGEWEVTIPESQFASGRLDLSGLTQIQVWIGYQFIH